MKNDNEIYSKIIKWMISESTNKVYIQQLNEMLQGIEGKKHIEEFKHPRHLSLVMFGVNLFPYRIEDYREMAELI